MKKQLFGLAVCSCVLLGTSCSNEDNFVQEQNTELYYVTASTDRGTDTRLSYDDTATALNISWRNELGSNPEKFFGFGGNGYLFTQTEVVDESVSKFSSQSYAGGSGELTEGVAYHLLYPAKDAYQGVFQNAGSTSVEVDLPLTGQTGELAALEDFHYMTCVATKGEGDLDIQFTNRIAILQLDDYISLAGITAATTATEITISGACIFSSAKLIMGNGAADIAFDGAASDITVTGSFAINANGQLANNVYIAFIPNAALSAQPLTITAKVGDDTYKIVKDNAPAFKQGRVYPVGGTLDKVDATAAKYEAALADFTKNNVPAEDIWVITDKEATTHLKLVEAIAAAGREISLEFPNMTKVGDSFLYKAYGCVSIDFPLLESCGKQLGRGQSTQNGVSRGLDLKYVNLPNLKSATENFLSDCDKIETLIIGTSHNENVTFTSNPFASNADVSKTNLYLNATEYEKVTGTSWRTTKPEDGGNNTARTFLSITKVE